MNRFALATAAILVATASAFAGSDHFGSDTANQSAAPVAGVDHAVTGAVDDTTISGHKAADAKMKPATTDWPEPGQGIWGN
ncbi:DUF680 domain-containing protein [Mesorhizobium sp. BH1-1-4]|uniref:DUF680 domain-containing protein n=1 Tax=Mesorhizobium sp. BH1-1-4 TaxID=2876662 RepID=UPI001CD11ED0|nr:DUF680 domain-containing protein [Mesorhizobium sp. BH1-1-4]MBZ9997194.1 DUF680 domain-containing protein [Mesorhizobium sp. BH1-1-4]